MTFRVAFLIELLGGALAIALILLAQHARAEGMVTAPCYPTGGGTFVCDSRFPPRPDFPYRASRAFSEDSTSVYYDPKAWPYDRPYADDYPGYAPLDPAVHDQLDRIERKLDELER